MGWSRVHVGVPGGWDPAFGWLLRAGGMLQVRAGPPIGRALFAHLVPGAQGERVGPGAVIASGVSVRTCVVAASTAAFVKGRGTVLPAR